MNIDWGKTFTSKTIWIAALTVIAGIVEYLSGLPKEVSVGTVILGVVNILIRYFTTDAIKKG